MRRPHTDAVSNSTDPGPEFWRRQAEQLTVIGAVEDLVDREPDRFTGLTAAGSGHVTLHVTDPAVLGDARLVALLEDARAVGIDVTSAVGPRSLRELRAIYDEILRTDPFRAHGVDAAEFRIEPATATVRILVADVDVDLVRQVFAPHGDAVVVIGCGPPDLSTRLGRHTGPRDGWPVPTLAPDDAAGRPVEEVAEPYRDEGFEVEVHDLGGPYALHSDLHPHRIRLLVADGRVVDATQA